MERNITEKALLKRRLERLYKSFDLKYLSPDPLEFVHRYSRPAEQEMVGLIAASLAYGRVAQILKSIERVLTLMDYDPLAFTLAFGSYASPHMATRKQKRSISNHTR